MNPAPSGGSPLPTSPAAPADRMVAWHRLSYTRQGLGLAGFLAAVTALQHVFTLSESPAVRWSAVAAAAVALAVLLVKRGRQAYFYLSTVQAGVLTMGALLVCTVIGTVVLQDLPPQDFARRYGAAAKPLQLLGLTDIFHAWFFRSLAGLIALASAVSIVRRRHSLLKWRNLGILAAHVSVLVILGGALAGAIYGAKGMIHLQVGESANQFDIKPKVGQSHQSGGAYQMGFAVRLDKFELDRHAQEFNFYTYAKDDKGEFKMIASDRPRKGAIVGQPAPGSAVQVSVVRVLSNAVRTLQGARHLIKLPGGQQLQVELGKTYDLADGAKIKVEAWLPDFSMDMTTRTAVSKSDEPNNPALAVRIGSRETEVADARLQYLFGRDDMREMMGQGGHGNGKGSAFAYFFDQGSGNAAWIEGPIGGYNPAVEVEVRWPGSPTERVMLRGKDSPPVRLGADRLLSFHEKPNDIKNYNSTLTIIEAGKQVVTQRIQVNKPLRYRGVDFYQSNYDPDNPNYSGLQVVVDPGLPVVEFGLWLLFLGTLHAVALRDRRLPKLRTREVVVAATARQGELL